MEKDLFQNLDLNLLRTFVVLSQELNMRKASERLFVSQPAISQSLQKLRRHFSDDLFIKSPKGLDATPFAIELSTRVTPLLDALSLAVNSHQGFDLKAVSRTVKIALTPFVLCSISGKLVQKVKQEAPLLDLHILSWGASTLEELEKGECLLGINYTEPKLPKSLKAIPVITTKPCLAVRIDHPLKDKIASPKQFAEYEIASLLVPGWNTNKVVAEDVLNRLGFIAKIGFRSEYPMALIDVVQETNMYMPTTSIFPFSDHPRLRAIDVEVDVDTTDIGLEQYGYHHHKHANDPLVSWLLSTIKELLTAQSEKTSQYQISNTY